MKASLIRTDSGLNELEDVWNETLQRSRADCVFLTWEWISNWWKNYGAGKNLRVVVLKDNQDKVVGIAPLYQREIQFKKGFTMREIRFIGTGEDVSPDYLDFIVHDGIENGATKAFMAALETDEDWDIVNLTDIPENSPSVGLLKNYSSTNGLKYRRKNFATCPYISLPATWEEFLAGLSANTRYNVKRRIKNLQKQYEVKYYIWKDQCRLPAAMKSLGELHTSRWASRGTSRSFVSREYCGFHDSIAGDFARNGWLHLSCLELDGKIAAMYYDYRYKGKILYYQAGFDPDFSRYSPGLVLRAFVIKEAIQEGIEEIDLLKGAYDFKYIWTDRSRRTVSVALSRRSLMGRMYLFENFDKPLVKAQVKKRLPAPLLRVIRKNMSNRGK